MNKPTPKEFALAQIAPYYKDPSTCGYDFNDDNCKYITEDGRMCVFGKNMIDPSSTPEHLNADGILERFSEKCLKPESRGVLSSEKWRKLQVIHDYIAKYGIGSEQFLEYVEESGLFTLEELQQYCKENPHDYRMGLIVTVEIV
jgi:hypothetical protein